MGRLLSYGQLFLSELQGQHLSGKADRLGRVSVFKGLTRRSSPRPACPSLWRDVLFTEVGCGGRRGNTLTSLCGERLGNSRKHHVGSYHCSILHFGDRRNRVAIDPSRPPFCESFSRAAELHSAWSHPPGLHFRDSGPATVLGRLFELLATVIRASGFSRPELVALDDVAFRTRYRFCHGARFLDGRQS